MDGPRSKASHSLRFALCLLGALLLSGCFVGGTGAGSRSSGPSASNSSSAPADPVTVTDYKGDFSLGADGGLTASETLTASFPAGRHGIFRFFDTQTRAAPSARLAPAVTGATLDGAATPVSFSWENDNRYLVAKVGDPNTVLSPGSHVFVISYTIPNAIFPATAASGSYQSTAGTNTAPAKSVFYWNVVAPGWQMPIEKASSRIHLPTPSGQVQCTAGAMTPTKQGPCAIVGAGTPEVTVGARNIPPVSGMTVRVSMATTPPTG